MPTFEIPQDIIDEWIYDATRERSAEDADGYNDGYNDGIRWAAQVFLSQLGIKVP
jgi:hypothetical protein